MKFLQKIAIVAMLASLTISCDMYQYDNYDAPNATISGKIIDQNGNAIQIEHGDGARITLWDIGYCENPKEQYLKVKGDGSFINTKIFKSKYNIVAEGPFVPLIQIDKNGNILSDKSLKNVTEENFEDIVFTVEPYLTLDWAEEPVINDNGSVTVKFNLNRGTDNPDYQKPLMDVSLFISTTQYVGISNYNKFYLTKVEKAKADAMIGKTNVMTSTIDTTHPLEKGRPYYIRIGARMDFTNIWGGNNYNYTTVKKIVFPK